MIFLAATPQKWTVFPKAMAERQLKCIGELTQANFEVVYCGSRPTCARRQR